MLVSLFNRVENNVAKKKLFLMSIFNFCHNLQKSSAADPSKCVYKLERVNIDLKVKIGHFWIHSDAKYPFDLLCIFNGNTSFSNACLSDSTHPALLPFKCRVNVFCWSHMKIKIMFCFVHDIYDLSCHSIQIIYICLCHSFFPFHFSKGLCHVQ